MRRWPLGTLLLAGIAVGVLAAFAFLWASRPEPKADTPRALIGAPVPLAAAVRPALMPAGVDDYSPAFGMGGGTGLGARSLGALSIRWEREWGPWSAVTPAEQRQGFRTLPMLDLVSRLREHGYSLQPADMLEDARNAYQSQAGQPVRYYLMGNEPNLSNICPETYADAYWAAWVAVQHADPAGKIIGPSVIGWTETLTSGAEQCAHPTRRGAEWFQVFVETYRERHGPIPMDAADLHLYAWYPADWHLADPKSAEGEVWKFEVDLYGYRSRLDVYPELAGKPIWVSEFGITHAWTGYLAGNPRDTDPRMLAYGTRLLRAAVETLVRLHQRPPLGYNVERWFPYVYSSGGPCGYSQQEPHCTQSFPIKFRGNAWAESEEPAPEVDGHNRESVYGSLYRRMSRRYGYTAHLWPNIWQTPSAPMAELIPHQGTVTYSSGVYDTFDAMAGQAPRFQVVIADSDGDLTGYQVWLARAVDGPTDDWVLRYGGTVTPRGAFTFDATLALPPGRWYVIVNAWDAAGNRCTGNATHASGSGDGADVYGERWLASINWPLCGTSALVQVNT